MTLPPSTDLPQPEASRLPPGAAELLEGMTEEQTALTLGLGVLVQRAAETEYILHGLYAHLGGVERPYTDKPSAPVSHFIDNAKPRLAATPNDQIPDQARSALLHDLNRCRASFDARNRYLHRCWVFDDEVHGWRTVKGTKGLSRPEISLVSSDDVWDPVREFARLRDKLIAWDAHFFGTPDDPDMGLSPTSLKHL
ncbi:hypothetical protein [Streptomyces sp. TLI_146]|uniref:hypothetical protein n=1 Tax=Streptomyces sp. TLI_146 TaxID=1938858 RepID=UPI000C70F9E3|nr:hypothetical protein [Streptomyces sp. TLI_146]PKV82811.1 hypothetical protein BX283_0272 [Streptomyces sp. TLI_146]